MIITPTNSQNKTITKNNSKFNNIIKMEQSADCTITIETENHVYKISRLGSLKSYIKQANY